MAGPILWVSGLVLSLRARNRAPNHHKLVKAGAIVPGITPMLLLVVILVAAVRDGCSIG